MKTIPFSAPALPVPSVDIVDCHPVTSSRKVAEYFGKDHKNVLRDIQRLPCSSNFRELNFEPTFYSVAGPNNSQRKESEFLLTKNGFIFLVMGFTGTKAAKLKEAYIAEFVRKREGGALAENRLGTLSPIRQDLLRRAVVRKAESAGVPPGKIWYRLMDAFRMPSHLHLAPEFFDRALLYLETLDLSDETRTKRLSHGILDRKDGHR
ncbi:MAG: Rha family transcriptional regulator [Leptospirales bacterium]